MWPILFLSIQRAPKLGQALEVVKKPSIAPDGRDGFATLLDPELAVWMKQAYISGFRQTHGTAGSSFPCCFTPTRAENMSRMGPS